MLGKDERQALLVLEDGSVYRGAAFAGKGEVLGEVVFNTGMTGYQEILTDPSYKGQIVAMTYPLIGNTGINPEDMESAGIHLEGFIVREYEEYPSNWRCRRDPQGVSGARTANSGVEGIDTRALTRRIRITGAMRGILSTETADIELLLERVRAYPGLVGRDLVKEVTCREPYLWKDGSAPRSAAGSGTPRPAAKRRVVVLDCGVKYNILRNLETAGLRGDRPAGDSDGRGDPRPCSPTASSSPTVPAIRRPSPISSRRSGRSWARSRSSASAWATRSWVRRSGGRTEKLKFGHHGINQPVKNCRSGRVEITSQNHGFVVLPESLPAERETIHDNLNDHTSEGICYPDTYGLQCPVPPRGGAGTARRGLSLRRVHRC